MGAGLMSPTDNAGAATGKAAQVLAAAGELFRAEGYGATSMDAVARRAGVSKATVYAHFSGKKELFAAMIAARAERLADDITAATADSAGVEQRLQRLARRILGFLLDPATIATYRVVVAEAARFPEVGRTFHESGPARLRAYVGGYLGAAAERGELSIGDVNAAASQFIALTIADLHMRALFVPAQAPDPAELDRQAASATAAFLKMHAPVTE